MHSRKILILLTVCAVFFTSLIAEAANLSSLSLKATTLAPQGEGRYIFKFSVPDPLNLSVGAAVYVDFSEDYGLVQDDLYSADPGCTLTNIQYKNPGDKSFSVLNGDIRVEKSQDRTRFIVSTTQDKVSVVSDVYCYLCIPGVINGSIKEGSSSVGLTVYGADGSEYADILPITLGDPPVKRPGDLTVTFTDSTRVEVSWGPVVDATCYQLYYSNAPEGQYIQAYDFGKEPQPDEIWSLDQTTASFSGVGNGGLEPGGTYYFKVRAGNAFGYGPFSVPVEVTLPVIKPQSTTVTGNQAVTILNQSVKILDPDKIVVYEKSSGEPVADQQVKAEGNKVIVTAPFSTGKEYQVVFYGQALENSEQGNITIPIFGWNFTITSKGSRSSGSSGSGTTQTELPVDQPPSANQEVRTFNDIQGHWAQRDIEIMAGKGYIKGTEGGLFQPNTPITRAEFAAILARCLDLPAVTLPTPFLDVSEGQWYHDSIARAFAAGLINGIGEGTFRPDSTITREQLAAMLVNALHFKEIDKPVPNNVLDQFADKDQISSWALQASALAVEQGLLKGVDGNFAPGEPATRAEATVMLLRLLTILEKEGGSKIE